MVNTFLPGLKSHDKYWFKVQRGPRLCNYAKVSQQLGVHTETKKGEKELGYCTVFSAEH